VAKKNQSKKEISKPKRALSPGLVRWNKAKSVISAENKLVGKKLNGKEINRITNIDQSSANNNANANPRVQQTNHTVINVDDDKSNADDDTCTLCFQAIRSDADRGYADTDGQCQCLRDYHYNC